MSARERPRQLRFFGIVLALLLGAIACRWRWPPVQTGPLSLAVVAGALLALAVVAPRALWSVYRPWMRAAHVLGAIQGALLLTLVFVFVLTPLGLAMRSFGWDPLDRRRRGATTFWRRRDPSLDAPDRLSRLY